VTKEPLLRVNNLEVVYNHTVQVLKGLSLAVPEGQVVALLGSNGAGKSTTLKAISGLLPMEDGEVTDGEIRFGGVSLAGLHPHEIARRGVFQVLEGRRVFEELTVEENLSCASYARGGAGDLAGAYEKVYGYFPRLAERRRQLAGYLSGGEQQMLAIGRALVARPKLMLLDEPSLGLSPILVEEIFGIVSRINREEGTTILLVEQNANMALSVSSFGYILENGKIVLDGPTSLLREDRDVREFYLGGHGGQRKSYRDLKHYKRRKRWLS
jgi:branched-chain amino acid transport system ATP-binding protein